MQRPIARKPKCGWTKHSLCANAPSNFDCGSIELFKFEAPRELDFALPSVPLEGIDVRNSMR